MQAIAVTFDKCAGSKLYENAHVFSISLRNFNKFRDKENLLDKYSGISAYVMNETYLYEWIMPFESPNQIVFDFILHKAVTVATGAVAVALVSAFNGIICAGWFRWYVSQP